MKMRAYYAVDSFSVYSVTEEDIMELACVLTA